VGRESGTRAGLKRESGTGAGLRDSARRECGSAGVRESGSPGVRECGSAGVRECGSPGVRECGSPGVRECGSPGVRESGSPGVRECGSAGVRESGSAGVRECGSAGVRESGSPGVRECGSAGVRECGSAGVRECGSAGVRECGSPGVRESGTAESGEIFLPFGCGLRGASQSILYGRSGCVSRVRGIVAWARCVWLASSRFAAEALAARQLYPAGRSRGAALAQYAMGCMLAAPGRAFSRRGKLGWVRPFFDD
jgi:hypothetical protein